MAYTFTGWSSQLLSEVLIVYEITFVKIFSFFRIISCLLLIAVLMLRFVVGIGISDSTLWLFFFLAILNILSFFTKIDDIKRNNEKN